MNKKFMAMLLVIVMVASMVPMTALAVEEHDCDYSKAVSVGNKQHKMYCIVEGCENFIDYAMNCRDENPADWKCDSCGGDVGTRPAPHEHNYVAHDNGDGTHTSSCNCGDTEDPTAHVYNNGVCECGAVQPCDHGVMVTKYYRDNQDGATHTITCDCGVVVNPAAAHEYNVQGDCACGAHKQHVHGGLTYIADNEDGATHTITCECGDVLNAAAPHEFNEQDICVCGAVREHECDYQPESNEDGTHNLVCVCGNSVNGLTCNDGNVNDGKCDTCGYRLYDDPTQRPNEHEHNYVAHSNNNGTHDTSCTCGLGEEAVACVDADKDGDCDDCGYLMPVAPVVPVAPQEPVELPSYAAVSTAGLDNVPKTGCAFVEWLYALIFG